MRGTTVAGRYRVVDTLGSGGMGEVWRTEDLHEGHEVALKTITLDGDPVREGAFRREAGVAARLSHPHVVAVRDHGTADLDGRRVLFLAMDLVDGQALSTRIAGPLPVADVLIWADQISQALDAAHHAGIVHRDVKPSNVLIDQDGAAMLCDFGIARLSDTRRHTLTVTGAAIGTPAYMSPEQARGDKTLGAPSDMYSLGCLLHELLTGTTPFDGAGWDVLHQHVHAAPAPLSTLRPGLPRELEDLVLELLEKDPGRRPTAAQVLARLARLHAALVADASAPTIARHHPPVPTVVDAAPRSSGAPRVSGWLAGAVTGAAITGELAWTTPMPSPWPATLGTLAGLLLSVLHLLDAPQPAARQEELRVSTVGLFTMLLIALGLSVGLLIAQPSMWWAAVTIAFLGGPVLVACTITVSRAVQHVLNRPTRPAELASSAGAFHTAALLLAADHVGFSTPAMLAAGLVLWPTTALITALVTSRRNSQLAHQLVQLAPSIDTTAASRCAVNAKTAVSRA